MNILPLFASFIIVLVYLTEASTVQARTFDSARTYV
jgi:hypothetical protein